MAKLFAIWCMCTWWVMIPAGKFILFRDKSWEYVWTDFWSLVVDVWNEKL